MAFAVVFVIVIINFYETPNSKAIKRENQRLLTQYKLMQKDLETIENVLNDLQQRDDNIYRVIFETEPIPSSIRNAGFGGSNKYGHLENMDNNELVISTARRLDILAKQAYVQSKSYDELATLIKNKEKMLASIPAIQPVSNKDLKRIASGFGYRIDPVYKTTRFHAGLDFTAESGTPVYATGDGVVEIAGSQGDGYGNKVVINNGYGYHTLFGHNSKVLVRVGEKVKRGQTIALVGSTGKSTGPHCHYEVWKNGNKIDPVNYFFNDISPEQYELVLKLSEQGNQSFD